MLLLGHASWAYVTGRLVGSRFGLQPNLYLLLLMGMLPDVDLLLGVFGLQHRTLTHSVVFWSLVFVPIFAKYRLLALPYFTAVTQHILFGDLLVGKTSIFWPLIDLKVGLAIPVLSPINLALEGTGFALFCIIAVRNGDLASQKLTPLAAVVIVPLVGFVILASASDSLLPIILEGSEAKHLQKSLPGIMANPNFYVALVLHVAMIVTLLAYSVKASVKKRVNARQIR